jgi:hypothetical protein
MCTATTRCLGGWRRVQDAWTGEVNGFAWNPEGTLARWSNNEPNSYARVFGYDEEGRLVKIERDYGAGGVQVQRMSTGTIATVRVCGSGTDEMC